MIIMTINLLSHFGSFLITIDYYYHLSNNNKSIVHSAGHKHGWFADRQRNGEQIQCQQDDQGDQREKHERNHSVCNVFDQQQ